MNSASEDGPARVGGLVPALRTYLAERQPPAPWWLGFSGGADSLAFAAALSEITTAFTAVHVDHGLHPDSPAWRQRCSAMAQALGFGLITERVTVSPAGEGLEAAARRARYAVFQQVLAGGGTLFLAHHADDQAETQLLQLLRGGGLAGLAGMARERPLGQGQLARPWLDQARQALQARAEATGLAWIEDPGNDELERDRNFLRHRVMPVIGERWADASQRLSRSAADAGSNLALLRDLADERVKGARTRLPLALLRPRSPGEQLWLVRRWLQGQGIRPPGRHRLSQGLSDLMRSSRDANPLLAWQQGQLRRHEDALYLLPPELPAGFEAITCVGPHEQVIPGAGRLAFERRAGGLRADGLDHGWYLVSRRGGERLRRGGVARPVKKLLQESRIAPWDKTHYPVIWSGDEPVALPGIAVADAWRARVGFWPVWIPDWQHRGQHA